MNLYSQKELEHIFYDDSAVKLLPEMQFKKNELCFRVHWHSRLELICVRSGSLILTVGKTEQFLSENEIAIINPCQLHGGFSGDDGVIFNTVMFETNSFCNDAPITEKYIKPINENTFLNKTSNTEILNTINSIFTYSKDKNNYYDIFISACIYKLIGLLYQNCLQKDSRSITIDNQFKSALDFINEHYSEPSISSAYLSQKYGYNEAYFCRVFKTITGMSCVNYINTLRLEYAQQLLAEKMLSVSEIAFLSGFSDPGYFTRCFKKLYSITPTEFIDREI